MSVRRARQEIHFFGDKTYEGGNDFEIFSSSKTIGHTARTRQYIPPVAPTRPAASAGTTCNAWRCRAPEQVTGPQDTQSQLRLLFMPN